MVRGRDAARRVGKIAIEHGRSKPPATMNPQVFRARIGRIGILRSVMVPAKIVRALGGAPRIPVLARYAGETTQSTLVPAGGAQRRLVLKMEVLRPAKLDTGSMLEVRSPPIPVRSDHRCRRICSGHCNSGRPRRPRSNVNHRPPGESWSSDWKVRARRRSASSDSKKSSSASRRTPRTA